MFLIVTIVIIKKSFNDKINILILEKVLVTILFIINIVFNDDIKMLIRKSFSDNNSCTNIIFLVMT